MIVQQLPFHTLIPINKDAAVPVYKQIANGLIHIIREGMIKPGHSIPPSRQMAELLQVHRKTVLAAYEELAAQDWVSSVPRKGMVVSERLPELKPQGFKQAGRHEPYATADEDFFLKLQPSGLSTLKNSSYRMVVNDGFPDSRIAPVDILLKQYRAFLKKSHIQGLFMLGDAAGSYNLRSEIARFISGTRAINITAENVLVTRGAQMAIFIAARMLIKPGSTVVVGEPGYNFANNIFEHMGAKLVKVKVDEYGIDVNAIERLCKKNRPDLLYLIPHHHHPTTVTLSAERRMKLLEVIRTYKLPVIEDDYDYDFHYNKSPILPLASADHKGYVLYIGSVTKSFAQALRVGYLIAGSELIAHAAQLREMMDLRGDVIMEEALAVLYRNGDMEKHINKAVKLYQQRRDLFCHLLATELKDMVTFTKPSGGMSVWVRFNEPCSLADIAERAAKQGIYINNGSIYNSKTVNYNALRMGFASMNEAEMKDLVATLKELM